MTVPTTGPFSPFCLCLGGNDVQQLVAIGDAAEVIDHHQPVAVAVERDASMGLNARDRRLQQFRRRGAATELMLRPFGEQPIGMISAPRSAMMRGPTL